MIDSITIYGTYNSKTFRDRVQATLVKRYGPGIPISKMIENVQYKGFVWESDGGNVDIKLITAIGDKSVVNLHYSFTKEYSESLNAGGNVISASAPN